MRLVVRADASPEIGTGHVMRCLALLEAWPGPKVLVHTGLPPGLAERFHGVDLHEVRDDRAFLDWLGPASSGWVALDGYHFPPDLQRAVQRRGARVLVPDDHGRIGEYPADLVHDPNPGDGERFYADRGETTRLLLGPKYALVRRELQRRDGPRDSALVTFGGNAPVALYEQAIEAVSRHGPASVILPPSQEGQASLKAFARRHGVDAEVDPLAMASHMARARLALCAGGSTNWELCHQGVPRIGVSIASNQDRVLEGLAHLGALEFVGRWPVDGLRAAFERLTADSQRQAAMAKAGRDLVDGQGARRVVEAMLAWG